MKHYYENIQGWFSFMKLYSDMVKRFPDGSHFVEVGSWNGKSAVYMGVEIVNSNKNIIFDCVDDWDPNNDIKNYTTSNNTTHEKAFNTFLKNIEPLSTIINYKRIDSVSASKAYDDESLDFVFIDAAHDYDNVMNDIISWYPKVKRGGIIAGHDYYWNKREAGEKQTVRDAVDDFFKKKNLDIRFECKTCWVHDKT